MDKFYGSIAHSQRYSKRELLFQMILELDQWIIAYVFIVHEDLLYYICRTKVLWKSLDSFCTVYYNHVLNFCCKQSKIRKMVDFLVGSFYTKWYSAQDFSDDYKSRCSRYQLKVGNLNIKIWAILRPYKPDRGVIALIKNDLRIIVSVSHVTYIFNNIWVRAQHCRACMKTIPNVHLPTSCWRCSFSGVQLKLKFAKWKSKGRNQSESWYFQISWVLK